MQNSARLKSKPVQLLLPILAVLCVSILAACKSLPVTPAKCSPIAPLIEPIDITKAVVSTEGKHYYIEGGQVWTDDQLAALMLYINELTRCIDGNAN